MSTPDHVFSEGQVSVFEDAGYTCEFLLDEGIIVLGWCLASAAFRAVGEGWTTAAIAICWVVAHNAFAVGEVERGGGSIRAHVGWLVALTHLGRRARKKQTERQWTEKEYDKQR